MTTSKPSTPSKAKSAVSKRNAKVGESTPDGASILKIAPSGIISPAGFSPRRLNKPQGLAIDKKDTYFIVAIKGGIIELIYLDSKRNKANDGYFPFVTGLATDGNGEYKVSHATVLLEVPLLSLFVTNYPCQGKDKNGKEYLYKCNDLLDLGIGYAFFRRKSVSENCRLNNELYDQKNERFWGRKCLVVVNTQVRTKLQRLTTVARLCDVTKKLNKTLRPGGAVNEYKVGGDLTPEDIDQGKSLDHYLLDEEINELMMNHVPNLSPTWAVDNPAMAKWFMDENRSNYPAFALEIGYVSTGISPRLNLPDEEGFKCSAEELSKPMSAEELAKYM